MKENELMESGHGFLIYGDKPIIDDNGELREPDELHSFEQKVKIKEARAFIKVKYMVEGSLAMGIINENMDNPEFWAEVNDFHESEHEIMGYFRNEWE